MTETHTAPDHAIAADLLSQYSGNDFADFFVDGFRAYAVGDDRAEAAPFGPVYAHLFVGEEITDDLASVYRILEGRSYPASGKGAHRSFARGLCAAFDRLQVTKPDDRVALKFVLRLAAKIQCVDLLAYLPRKVFDEPGVDDEALSDLRAVASEAILNLVSGNADAGNHLRDIARSRFFRPEDADQILLALCEVEAPYLAEHLALLETALVEVYGDADAEVDDALLARRVLLLLDMSVPVSVLGEVIEYALDNPNWRLAWIGKVLFDVDMADLSADDREKAGKLLELVAGGRGKPRATASLVKACAPARQSQADRRVAFEALNAEEIDEPLERGIAAQVIHRLVGVGRAPRTADLPRAA